jgi:hypothetical protein
LNPTLQDSQVIVPVSSRRAIYPVPSSTSARNITQ